MISCPNCGAENPENLELCQECGHPIDPKRKVEGQLSPTTFRDVRKKLASILEGQYQIVGEIGRGGMAIVYKALDIALERTDAIKVLPLELAYDKEFVERFHREAKTAARLHHPNIITIYSVRSEEDLNFMIMKFVEGKSLKQLIKEKKTIPVEEAVAVLKDVCSALFYAHKEGVIHRDIKPDNIMLDRHGSAVVMDFGIAKAATSTQLTSAGSFLGTASYMAPEQIKGSADHRADLYALGIMAYKMVAGRVPFRGKDSHAIHYQHIHEEPLPPSKYNPLLNKRLEQWILRLLRKDRDDRYQSAREAQIDLEALENDLKAKSQLLTAPVAGLDSASLSQSVSTFFKEGMQAYLDKRFDEAISIWEKVLALDPSYVKAIEHIRKAQEAMDSLRKVAQYLQAGQEAFNEGNFEQAIKSWSQVLALDSDHPEAFQLITEARGKLSRREKHANLCAEARELMEQLQFDEAREKFREVLNAHPDHSDALRGVRELEQEIERGETVKIILAAGDRLFQQRDFSTAIRKYEEVFSLFPNYVPAAQRVERAKSCIERQNDIPGGIVEARQLLADGQFPAAQSLLEELDLVEPDHTEIRSLLETANTRLEEHEAARALLEALAGDTGAGPELHLSQLEQHLARCEEFLARFPNQPEVSARREDLNRTLTERRHYLNLVDKGLRAYEERDYATALECLGEARTFRSDDAKVAEAYEDARDIITKRRTKELKAQGKAFEDEGKYGKAVEAYLEWLSLEPTSAGALAALKQARQLLQRRERQSFLLARGKSLAAEGRYDEAVRDLREVIVMDPDNAQARALLESYEPKATARSVAEDAPVFTQMREFIQSDFRLLRESTQGEGALVGAAQSACSALRAENLRADIGGRLGVYLKTSGFPSPKVFEHPPKMPLLFEDIADITPEYLFGVENELEPLLYSYADLEVAESGEDLSEALDKTMVGGGGGEMTRIYVEEKDAGPVQVAALPVRQRLADNLRKNAVLILMTLLLIGTIFGMGYYALEQLKIKERQDRIDSLFTNLTTAKVGNQPQLVLSNAVEILKLDPENESATREKRWAEKQIADAKTAAELEAQKRELRGKLAELAKSDQPDDWRAGLEAGKALLALEPGSQFVQEATDSFSKRLSEYERSANEEQFLANKLAEGKELSTSEDFEVLKQARAALDEVLSIRPDHAEALALREGVQNKLVNFENTQKVELLRTELDQAIAKGDDRTILAKASTLLSIDPGNSKAREAVDRIRSAQAARAQSAETERQKKNVLDSAKTFLAAQNYDDAIEKAQELLDSFDAENAEAKAIITAATQAKQAISKAQALEAQIEQAQRVAREAASKALATKDFKTALAAVEEGLKVAPDNADLLNLKRQIEKADADTDREPPTITLDSNNPKNGTAGDSVSIKAEIKDPGPTKSAGLDTNEVKLYYRYKRDANWEVRKMSVRLNRWEAPIDKKFIKNAGEIEYKIVAKDQSGNTTETKVFSINITQPVLPGGM